VHTDRTELKWQNDIEVLETDRLLLGYKYSWESVEAKGGFSPYDADYGIQEAWAQYDLARGAHQLVAGFRYLDHEDAGSKPTWSLNYGYAWSPATHLFASVATAFRVPTANERYGFGGNPGLEPELVNPPWGGYNRNIAEARIDGVELGYDFTGEQLLRRSRYSLDVRIGYDWNRWHFGANLDASYRVTEEWQLFAKLENAFDEDYQLASGYNTAVRTGYVGIRYR